MSALRSSITFAFGLAVIFPAAVAETRQGKAVTVHLTLHFVPPVKWRIGALSSYASQCNFNCR